MASQPPEPWTFAARAAFFGDRVCAFCGHHNPAAARFCNDCAAPLHLRPCKQCDAINDHAARYCHNCGAAFPALVGAPVASRAVPAADASQFDDAGVPASAEPLALLPAVSRARPRSIRPGRLLLAAIAGILVAGAYATYRMQAVTGEPAKVAMQPTDAPRHTAPEPRYVAPETAQAAVAELDDGAPAEISVSTGADTAQYASPRPPVPAVKRPGARQRAAPAQTAIDATPRVGRASSATPVAVAVAKMHEPAGADRWQAMHASLARCSGDLIARIVCEQRVRRHFCEGHWGKALECAGLTNDHGQ